MRARYGQLNGASLRVGPFDWSYYLYLFIMMDIGFGLVGVYVVLIRSNKVNWIFILAKNFDEFRFSCSLLIQLFHCFDSYVVASGKEVSSINWRLKIVLTHLCLDIVVVLGVFELSLIYFGIKVCHTLIEKWEEFAGKKTKIFALNKITLSLRNSWKLSENTHRCHSNIPLINYSS